MTLCPWLGPAVQHLVFLSLMLVIRNFVILEIDIGEISQILTLMWRPFACYFWYKSSEIFSIKCFHCISIIFRLRLELLMKDQSAYVKKRL